MIFNTQFGDINIKPINEHRMVAETSDPITGYRMHGGCTNEVQDHRKKDGQRWYIDYAPYSAGVYRAGTIMADVTDNAKRKVYAEVEKLANDMPQDALYEADREFREQWSQSLEERSAALRLAAMAAHRLAEALVATDIPIEEARKIEDRHLITEYVSKDIDRDVKRELRKWFE